MKSFGPGRRGNPPTAQRSRYVKKYTTQAQTSAATTTGRLYFCSRRPRWGCWSDSILYSQRRACAVTYALYPPNILREREPKAKIQTGVKTLVATSKRERERERERERSSDQSRGRERARNNDRGLDVCSVCVCPKRAQEARHVEQMLLQQRLPGRLRRRHHQARSPQRNNIGLARERGPCPR